ncbi:TIGR03643 family protein [Methylophilus medardicus]|uniref:TIGR03643 family protein n=1 Tax=Methylophilus medardicus TaxID=2588534 RepID=A0A5B8CQ72_9PROT|nr:TIGR03643 family protein [Methylophilus medardicus]QDC43398.1 TIGR03643 family protein [Methylophilus medardicus]QDC48405.1 TIGR03643 family protein [Methylophilus medardicus]QDC52110.1 TIGR03643 family protein [Methylophilus medardicus]
MDRSETVLLTVEDISRIIEMAWEDRTPFEAIEYQFGLKQADVIVLMRQELKPGSFMSWRKRTRGQQTKHQALRSKAVNRHCSTYQHKQYRP